MKRILILLSMILLMSSCFGKKEEIVAVPDNAIIEDNQVDIPETPGVEQDVETEGEDVGIEERTVEVEEVKIETKEVADESRNEEVTEEPQHEDVSTKEETTEETDELIEDMIGDIDDIFKELEVE